jgi:imidazoleglycerol phosphate synthase glutamine amidotransferase subunit HisH
MLAKHAARHCAHSSDAELPGSGWGNFKPRELRHLVQAQLPNTGSYQVHTFSAAIMCALLLTSKTEQQLIHLLNSPCAALHAEVLLRGLLCAL